MDFNVICKEDGKQTIDRLICKILNSVNVGRNIHTRKSGGWTA